MNTDVRERPILFTGPMVRAILDGSKTQTRRIVKHRVGRMAIVPDHIAWLIQTRTWRAHFPTHPSGLLGAFEDVPCPYGGRGGVLYVRETWSVADVWRDTRPSDMGSNPFGGICYEATPGGQERRERFGRSRPGIHMPKDFARLWPRVLDIRVERVGSISHSDCLAEGVRSLGRRDGAPYGHYDVPGYPEIMVEHDPYHVFGQLWDMINASPKLVSVGGVAHHYKAFPFSESHPVCRLRGFKGLPLIVYPNPWVWVVEFEKALRPE